MKNNRYMSMAAAALLMVSCASDVTDASADGQHRQDSRISVAMAVRDLEVATRATGTVVANSFTGREPSETNPFHPMVWFSQSQGQYTGYTEKDATHNEVNFTSSTLTFPDIDINYDTANPDNPTYCIGLYPTNAASNLWNVESNSLAPGWDDYIASLADEDKPKGTVLAANITGREDLMLAKEVHGSINDKFNSTYFSEENDPADKRLNFRHLLTWLKVRVSAGEQGAGDAWGKVTKVQIETPTRVRVDLGTGDIYPVSNATLSRTANIDAFMPNPSDQGITGEEQYKELEPSEPEDPEIASVMVVPQMAYKITYRTEKMNADGYLYVPLTILRNNRYQQLCTVTSTTPSLTVTANEIKDENDAATGEYFTVNDARNNVFVFTLTFYNRSKVEATCSLEPMTDEQDQLYGGSTKDALTVTVPSDTYTYNGDAHTLSSVTVVDESTEPDTELDEDTDYTLVYSNNINAGTAVVTAVGKGDYAGRLGTATYTIGKAAGGGSISFAESSPSTTYGVPSYTNALDTSTLTGDGIKSYTLTYTSDNDDVATVNASSGQVTIHKAGPATITATIGDGENHHFATPPSASYTLTVNKASTGISYAVTAFARTYGDDPFTNNLRKNDLADGTIAYSSSNPAVASIDANGEVTILKSGEVTITATATDGDNYRYDPATASYTITVGKAAATVSYAVSNLTKRMGAAKFTNELSLKGPKGEDATAATITYASSNTDVAIVDAAGQVTILTPGYAVISATVTDDDKYTYETKTVKYAVTVTED